MRSAVVHKALSPPSSSAARATGRMQDWVPGFQKLASEADATCFVKYPGHPVEEAGKVIWDFASRRLRPQG